MKKKKISIVIPLYNKAKYIARALDSVLAQTFTDFDIIVLDDGSTDEGPDIVNKYNDSRVKLIHQNNIGPGAARNRGILESGSEYVVCLDADDEFAPEFLEVSLRSLEENPECVLSIVDFIFVGKDDSTRKFKITPGVWRLPENMEPSELNMTLGHILSATLFRRDVIMKMGGFYENHCTYGEDKDLWLRVLLNYKVFWNTDKLVIYHIENSGLYLPNQKMQTPVWPFLKEPERIQKSCPEIYRDLLEKFLAYMAVNQALVIAGQGNTQTAQYLVEKYPLMNLWRWEYTKVITKIRFPWIVPLIRLIKSPIVKLKEQSSL